MNLSLVAPKYNYSKKNEYFGFFSENIEDLLDHTFLLRNKSKLSIKDLENIEKKSIEINNILIEKFIEYRNENKKSFHFFQFYLNPLLIFVSQTYFYRLRQLYIFLEYYDCVEIEKIILFPLDYKFHKAINTSESIILLNEDAFSSWINSYIFFSKKQFFNKYPLYFIDVPEKNRIKKKYFHSLKRFAKKILFHKNDYERELLRIKKNLKVENRVKREFPEFNDETNEDVENIFKLFLKIAPLTYFNIPKSHVYNIESLIDRAVIFNGLKIYDDNYRSYISKKFNSGNTIVGVQHGGHNYGTGKFVRFLINELMLCDYFVTWGWELNLNTHTKYLKIQRQLNICPKSDNISPEKILWVGTHMNINPSRLDSNPQPSDFIEYRTKKLEALIFLKSEQSIYEICYRPYFTNFNGLNDLEYFLTNIPSLSIVYDKNLEKILYKFKLLIIDHPGTLLNFAIAKDIPIICFWSDDYFYFTDEAIKMNEEFKKVKLLFSEISILINHLSNINDINIWWKSAEVERVKKQYKFYYSNIKNNDIN